MATTKAVFRDRTLKMAIHKARKAGYGRVVKQTRVNLPKIGARSVMHPWTGWIVEARKDV